MAGGGLERAEETLRRSLTLFQGEQARDGWPHWGKVDAQTWLGIVLAAQGEVVEALRSTAAALPRCVMTTGCFEDLRRFSAPAAFCRRSVTGMMFGTLGFD